MTGMARTRTGGMMRNVMALCERMAAAAIEMRLITRLPVLVDEYGHAYRALREPDQVRILLEIDQELLLHARPSLHRNVLAAIDEVARTSVEGLDRDGWREVLLAALEVDDPPDNLINLAAYRTAPAYAGRGDPAA